MSYISDEMLPKTEPGTNAYGDVDFAEMFGLNEFIPRTATSNHVKVEPSLNAIDSLPNKTMVSGKSPQKRQLDTALANQLSAKKANVSKISIQNSDMKPEAMYAEMSTKSCILSSEVMPSLSNATAIPKNAASISGECSEDIYVQYSYLCPHCTFISAHRTSARRHINTTHASLQLDGPSKIGEKELYLCRHCDFNSNHKTSAKRHVKTIHKGLKTQSRKTPPSSSSITKQPQNVTLLPEHDNRASNQLVTTNHPNFTAPLQVPQYEQISSPKIVAPQNSAAGSSVSHYQFKSEPEVYHQSPVPSQNTASTISYHQMANTADGVLVFQNGQQQFKQEHYI